MSGIISIKFKSMSFTPVQGRVWPSNTSLGYFIQEELRGDIKDYVLNNKQVPLNNYLRWWARLNNKQRFYFKEMDARNQYLTYGRIQKPKSYYTWKRTNQL